jgi:hypothetical protein
MSNQQNNEPGTTQPSAQNLTSTSNTPPTGNSSEGNTTPNSQQPVASELNTSAVENADNARAGSILFETLPLGGEGDVGGWFERILWFAAGADARLLDRCPRSDKVKYQGLGGIVLATGLLAWLAMTFAVSTIFYDNEVMVLLKESGKEYQATLFPLLIGLLWGLIIFNLDRFIISSTGKGDGTDRITGGELINGLPRILMALVIALSISAPLEIKLFDEEITKKFKLDNDKLMSEKEHEFEIESENNIQEIQNIINIKLSEKKEQDLLYVRNQEKVQFEISNGGCKDKCEEFKILMATADAKSKAIQEEINKLQLRIDERNEANQIRLAEIRKDIYREPGLLERLILLENLPGAELPVWIVRLLFIVIEVGPIFFKMMLTRSVYDHFKHNQDELRLAENEIFPDNRIQLGPNQTAVVETFYQYGRPYIRQREAQLRVQEQGRINDEVLRQWQQYLVNQISNHPEQFRSDLIATNGSNAPQIQPEETIAPDTPSLNENVTNGIVNENAPVSSPITPTNQEQGPNTEGLIEGNGNQPEIENLPNPQVMSTDNGDSGTGKIPEAMQTTPDAEPVLMAPVYEPVNPVIFDINQWK